MSHTGGTRITDCNPKQLAKGEKLLAISNPKSVARDYLRRYREKTLAMRDPFIDSGILMMI